VFSCVVERFEVFCTQVTEGFRVKTIIRRQVANSKRRIERRLAKKTWGDCSRPMFSARNIQYEIAERSRAIAYGGIGLIHALVHDLGLIDAIDNGLHVLKIHRPYHESDHVLNIAYNPLCDGSCLEDMERRRNDEVFLDALGAQTSPDPTTAGDFCRRFDRSAIDALQDIFDDTRLRVWSRQPDAFFEEARIDMDGTLVGTTGQCKQGMDISYDGTWGYHPLVLTLANTREVLRIVNRSGNRPSHEGAAGEVDRALTVCWRAGFRRVLLRGDTDFSQTEHLDRWNADPRVRFIFGYDARANVRDKAEGLPERAWHKLERPPRYAVRTQPRQRPDNVKEALVVERAYVNQKLCSEEVAEFNYQPTACQETYRMVVVRKNISVEKGEQALFAEVRYFFYITNDWEKEADALVFSANDRCHQENLIEQLKNGAQALKAPSDTLESNGAYMVMTALAWNLKAWLALTLPEKPGRWQAKHQEEKRRMLSWEFKKFVQALVHIPCQIVRTGRRLVYRLLAWNPHQSIFFRVAHALRC
jgi:hypothetical protein